MDKFSRTILFFLLFFLLIILQFRHATLDEEGVQKFAQTHLEKPLLSKIWMDTVALLKNSQQSSWEKVKTVIHDLQMQFSPPNLDFRSREGVGEESDGIKGTLKEAVEKSVGTVEESAESAAKVVDGAIHKTKEKVKDSSDSHHESKAEL